MRRILTTSTILLGVGFLGGQAFEYLTLIRVEGFTISSGIYGSVFYSLTGLHGLHVTAGVMTSSGRCTTSAAAPCSPTAITRGRCEARRRSGTRCRMS